MYVSYVTALRLVASMIVEPVPVKVRLHTHSGHGSFPYDYFYFRWSNYRKGWCGCLGVGVLQDGILRFGK
jgi:hypothetical protein